MDIKILDSWLRDHLQTDAKPDEIARSLSLTSASIEKIEPYKENDFIYHIEVTTNRPDMASVIGLAREAAAVLPRFEIPATFSIESLQQDNSEPLSLNRKQIDSTQKATMAIINDDTLVRRICAVVLEVELGESPQFIKDRIEASGTRSLNNLIDITNYVMHETGHPTHAFDYDRLPTKKFIIRQSKKGEKIMTLDKKTHILPGGDIVADNGNGEIVDLLGIMGTENSVVTDTTKRILFFIDNNDPQRIRKTSMSLAIRTEAAGLNEKDIDPELAMSTLLRGIKMYQKYANAKIVSDIIDIYPHKSKIKTVIVSKEKISKLVGIDIPIKQSINILQTLGFQVKEITRHPELVSNSLNNQKHTIGSQNELGTSALEVTVPSWRNKDVEIEEDIIEEIARVFGYYNIPSDLPPFTIAEPYNQEANVFYWESRAKEAMKYWGFTETYTYSLVSEKLLEDSTKDTITLENPLDADHAFLRKSITPSLLEIIHENRGREEIKIFEIANIYMKNQSRLPQEVRNFAAIWKKENVTFYHMKGIVEQIANAFGIYNVAFKDQVNSNTGAEMYFSSDATAESRNTHNIHQHHLGYVKSLDNNLVSFELNFDLLTKQATLKKTFTPIPKFPPIIEDLALILDQAIKTGSIIDEIKKQSPLITTVSLLDQFENSRTFHIVYQDKNKNLTSEEITMIRGKIIKAVSEKFSAKLKE